jgi:hypothetical protein
MTDVDLTRRRLLIAAAGLGAAVVAGPIAMWPVVERFAASDPAALLRGLVTHRGAAVALGRSYLEANPTEAHRADLVRNLVGARVPASTSRASREVASRIRADYRAGRTVVVEGWVLSRTEARLCALIALT